MPHPAPSTAALETGASAAHAPTSLASWVRALPSAGLALGVLDLVLADSSQLLNDPDSIWHVAVGRWIWEHRQLPFVDVFSHTFDGAPWIAKEWLSQLVLSAMHAAAGWWGVVVLAALCIAVAFVVLHEWLRRRLRPSTALALTLAAILLGLAHFLARPHVLVLPVIALWMGMLVGAAERGRAPPLVAVFLVVVWTNMHGSFPLGLGMAALLATETVVFAAAGTRTAAWRSWWPFLALAGAAVLATPYGWRAILVPLTVGGVDGVRYINEWKPLQLDTIGIAASAALATSVLLLLRGGRREAFRILAVGLLGVMMIRHVRFIGLFGLIVPFLVARVLAARWGAAVGAPSPPRPALVMALVAPLAVVVGCLVTMRPAPTERVAPERALAFAQAQGGSGPVYNAYDFGGFLIGKGIKTFIDGRTDQLFVGGFMPKLMAALDSKDSRAFAALLAHHRVTWALVKPHSKDAAKLTAIPGWSRLYADGVAVVYASGSRPAAPAVGSTTP